MTGIVARREMRVLSLAEPARLSGFDDVEVGVARGEVVAVLLAEEVERESGGSSGWGLTWSTCEIN